MSSNKSRDRARLIALDVKIQELEYLYTKEKMQEDALGKRTLLVSNAYKNRIKTLDIQRRQLRKTLETLNVVQSNYAAELGYREAKVASAIGDLEAKKRELTAEIKNCQELEQLQLMQPDLVIDYENIKFITKEIPKIQTRIRNYQRAVNNWKTRGTEIAPRVLSREQREIVKELDAVIEPEQVQLKTPASILERNINWDIKVTNPASIDLITQPQSAPVLAEVVPDVEVPRKRVVIDFD